MFPNPQDALPLPPRPNLDRYRKLAKELVRASESGAIRAWAERWIAALARLSGAEGDTAPWIGAVEAFARRQMSGAHASALSDAQFVIARSHGFESWPKFAKHLEERERADSSASRFEAAADAIANGDEERLKALLAEDPALVHQRSAREHGATLLHYVAANGVENWRQKTPPNIVAIAEILLAAGAAVDATADVYGGGCTPLGLAATSIHPETAGVQEDLLRTLLEHGADMRLPGGGRQQLLVTSCLANGRGRAAAFLADRGAPLDLAAAAGLGRLDLVDRWFDSATAAQRKDALLYACEFGASDVVRFLLEKGLDPAMPLRDSQTPLHWAVIGGQLEIVTLLLEHGPPLEARNVYGGTVLGQALWSAAHGGDPEVYERIIETLIAAGAKE
ncbi:MAG TPA: ankyrin repeat domain-containing protein [Thermoanaerobaculia bacterium]|nr:ankyrin repeat domain-containing protein [Thermoanaerobaculia bacterium]